MNKGELIEAVASATGSTKAEAGRAIDATVDAVTGCLLYTSPSPRDS